MESTYKKLLSCAYNIVGSHEDAKDLVQDVMEKYITLDRSNIIDETGYLIKSVVNHSINFKNKARTIKRHKSWLPEPILTEGADKNIMAEEIASFSMLVLMEKLTAKERAVFILKEAFNYSHEEIADVVTINIENSRKLLSRAKEKLESKSFDNKLSSTNKIIVHEFAKAIQTGDLKTLESLLRNDILLTADGGKTESVVSDFATGVGNTIQLLTFVYDNYQKNLLTKIIIVNHQYAIIYYDERRLYSIQILEVASTQISKIFSIVDPLKLNNLNKFILY